MDFANVAVPIAFSVWVMVTGAILGGRFINGVGSAVTFRILVAVPVALTAAAMVSASVNAITPTAGYNNVIFYAVAAVALYGVLWPPTAMVIANGYPSLPRLRFPKRRNRHYAGMTFEAAVAKRIKELSR